MTSTPLVLGPMVRYVDEQTVSIWVEVAFAGEVVIRAGGRSWAARSFGVHGRHYALVDAIGLPSGTVAEYTVELAGVVIWPHPDSDLPPSRLTTLKPGKPPRLAFGSCRKGVTHDQPGNEAHGVDSLRAYALRMAATSVSAEGERRWPDMLAFLGDQVYADETSQEMRDFISARRDLAEAPWTELRDYEEYAYLYFLAWSDPVIRWLFSTLPTVMIFDDHDIRDDWNTSEAWRRDIEATSWWHGRIVGGLASYWVYQHLGNMSPEERSKDPLWGRVLYGLSDTREVDLTEALDALAERADREPSSYTWSYSRQVGRCRLVVVDSRAARVVQDGRR